VPSTLDSAHPLPRCDTFSPQQPTTLHNTEAQKAPVLSRGAFHIQPPPTHTHTH